VETEVVLRKPSF